MLVVGTARALADGSMHSDYAIARRMFVAAVGFVAMCLSAPALAQTPPAPEILDLSLEQLLGEKVTSAVSKFEQPTTDAPASITIVTADEIRRHGHRTLADVLRAIPGLYVTYDRNYSYLGIRGFARPGDYNTRVLLLVDGHRLNDPIYDMAPIGTDFPVDVALIDRVEVIRGPGSALYGTSAFLGTINIVTRTGALRPGMEGEASAGSLGTQAGRVTFGRVFGMRDVVVSASGFRSDGLARAYYPEFDSPDTFGGVATGLDRDEGISLFGTVSFGHVSIRAAHNRRDKDVPTGAWDSAFGIASHTQDERSYVSATYLGRLGRSWSGTIRAAYDRYYYAGRYPIADSEPSGPEASVDDAISDTVSGEATASRSLATRHFLTVGSEARGFVRANQRNGTDVAWTLDDQRHGGTWAGYVQDNIALVPGRLSVNIGIRGDHHDLFGFEATPRAGVIFKPSTRTSLKLLHGSAYRAPNYYERYYNEAMRARDLPLAPERIRTDELVWEQTFGRHVRSSANLFHSRVNNLITAVTVEEPDSAFDGQQYFVNLGTTTVTGMSADVEARWASGASVRASHERARTRDGAGARISNSPAWLGTVSAIVPVVREHLTLAAEGQYVGPRLGVRGIEVEGYYIQNVTVSSDRMGHFDVSLSMRNLFDARYADPGAEEHRQNAIPQDGRTITARVNFRF